MAETRELILAAAERLYAERGLNGVSLREITEAAGQRNNAAVHYHFGGRDGLVVALFEHRHAQMEAQRAPMLAELDAQGRGQDVRELLRVLIAPFAEAGDDNDWVRFVARLHEDARFNPFGGDENPYAAPGSVTAVSSELTRRLRARLDLPAQEADARMYLVITMAVHAVADRQALVTAGAASRLPSAAELLDAIVEAAVAILTR